MAHDVFISYSSKDKTIADAVCAALEAAKIRCWIAPRDILPGEKWAASISKAIAGSRIMVLVFTSNSTNSEDVLNELLLAKDNRVIIIPFKIGDILPSGEMGYYLSRTHWLDAMNPPTEQEIQKLVEIANRFMTGEVFWRKDKNDTAIIESEKEKEKEIPIPEKKEIGKNRDPKESKVIDSSSSISPSVALKQDYRAISKEEERPAKQHEVMRKAKESEDLAARKKDKIISQKTIIIAAIVLGSLLLGYWMNTQNPINAPETVNTTPQPTPMSIQAVSPIATIQPGTFTNSIGMDFVTIPKGDFDMGSTFNEGGDRSERPVHRVNIPKSFYMSKYEVTQKQWQEVMGDNPSQLKGDDLPVEQVSWNDVQEFINKLNEKEGVNKYRLPSEAEWEYAIRAGTNTKYFFGDNVSELGEYAWLSEENINSHPVGQKKPNPWGLYDMRGNGAEWMQDIYHEDYNSAPSNGSAWEGLGSNRVTRGSGSCVIDSYGGDFSCRSASRYYNAQNVRHSGTGFRLVMEINSDSNQTQNITQAVSMDFALIPKGEFDMGSPANEIGRDRREGPVHRVNISKSFYMGKYEVTQKQWQEVMGNNPSQLKGDDLPVEQVSWNDVQEFINKLNDIEGVNKYRLPSEAEWEYAIRAGTNTKYFFGDNVSELGDYAWYSENPGRSHPVGQKKPNPWGLYDMRGNVFEWTQDIFHDNYNGAPLNGSAWEGMGSNRVIRGSGGCIIYIDKDEHCRSASREFEAQGIGNYAKGFRLVMEINTDIKQT